MGMIKHQIREATRRMGFRVHRVRPGPFPQLRDVRRYETRTVPLNGHDFKLGDAASFLAGYREIFEDEIYRFDASRDDPVVIDCGANYGVSIAYFKSVFPKARITAVEADPAIFSVLSANVENMGGPEARLVNKAVSHDDQPLFFNAEGADGGRTHALDAPTSTVRVDAVTLDELIGGAPVDFLKIDIEGAETEALAACTQLGLVRQMFIEYHSFKDSEQSLDRLLAILREAGFRYYIHSQFCSPAPLVEERVQLGMDLQLNIFAKRA